MANVRKWAAIWILALIVSSKVFGAEPFAVYLTWRGDPSSTMVIQWLGEKEDQNLHFREVHGKEVVTVESQSRPLRKGITSKMQWVELTQLQPDTEYLFWIGDKGKKASKRYRFRTLPLELKEPLRFAVGGDAYYNNTLFRKMNKVVAKQNPAFVIMGGDIAYAHGHTWVFSGPNWDWDRWKIFLKTWTEQMVDKEGRLIPIIPVVGNHDIKGNLRAFQEGRVKKPLFYDLFVFREEMGSYRMFDVGGVLSVFLLDTGHTHPIEGVQKEWLEQNIEKQVPYKLAVYHVPAYPALDSYMRRTPSRVREHWSPLFEKGGVQAAFEHHSHAYKRTVPIREGEIDPSGVVYLGDGSWGTRLRNPVKEGDLWYIAKTKSVNAAFIVDIAPEVCTIRAINNKGRVFDETTLAPR